MHVSESDIHQGLQFRGDFRICPEKLIGFADRHLQDVIDVFALVPYCKGVFLVALASANLAWDGDAGQEVHLYQFQPCSLALLASASGHVEREAPGLETAYLGIWSGLEKRPYVVENPCESGGIAAGTASDGGLVHLYNLVDILDALYLLVRQRFGSAAIEFRLQDRDEGFVDEAAFPAAAYSGDADDAPQGEVHVDALEIVAAGAAKAEREAVAATPLRRHRNLLPSRQIAQRLAVAFPGPVSPSRPGEDDPPSFGAGPRTDIHQPVGCAHGGFVMFHHNDGIPFVTQLFQGRKQLYIVPLVQPD